MSCATTPLLSALSKRWWQIPIGAIDAELRIPARRVATTRHLHGLGRRAVLRRALNDGWAAPPGQRSSTFGHSPRVVEGPAQQHLNLCIDASKLIGGPAG